MFNWKHTYNLEMRSRLQVEPASSTSWPAVEGLVWDGGRHPLYRHLRPRHQPTQLVAGCSRRYRGRSAGQALAAATLLHPHISLDGAELEVYRLTSTLVGTLYTFDLDYHFRDAAATARPTLADCATSASGFAHDQASLAITIRSTVPEGKLPPPDADEETTTARVFRG